MAAAGGKKLGKLVKGMRKTVEKVIHPPFLKTYIPAGQATPAPPLGTQLGQVSYWLTHGSMLYSQNIGVYCSILSHTAWSGDGLRVG